MNGEASNAFMAELKRHITRELAESQGELRRDLDALAEKLRDVVEALVQADGSLAQRIAALEQGGPNEPPKAPKRRWRRRSPAPLPRGKASPLSIWR